MAVPVGSATLQKSMPENESSAEAYHELCAYTLSHGAPEFLHQHVVDAFAAQGASVESKPIGVTMALVGLYLHAERGFTGRQVQRVHMLLAQRKRQCPPSRFRTIAAP